MKVYSRETLFLLRNSWKSVCKNSSYGSVHRPLSRQVWEKLRSYDLLAPVRGQRGGNHKREVFNRNINVVNISEEQFRHFGSKQRKVNETNLLNIQAGISISHSESIEVNQVPSQSPQRAATDKNFKNTFIPNHSTSFPKNFLSNARSMVNKLDDISGSVTNNHCDIGVITESWLSSCVTDQLVNIPGFVTCRRDRPDDQRGGGLCTFINSRFDFIELRELNDPDIESQWFVIKPHRLPRGINSIIMGTVYHPPRNDDNKLRAHLFNSLDSALFSYPNSAIIVLGDFNQFKPENLCSSFKLKKLVTKPTRGSNILDQAYSTLLYYYDDALILPPVGFSDHSSVLLQPSMNPNPSMPTTRVQKRDCRASNRNALFASLQAVNWSPLYYYISCEDQLNKFQSVLSTAIDNCLPYRSMKLHPTDKPWMTAEIKDAIKRRQHAWVKDSPLQYKLYRNKVNSLCKQARRRFYRESISHTRDTNPKKWWDNIKLVSGLSKPAPLSSITIDGSVLRDNDLVEAINDTFSRVANDIPPLEFTPIPVTAVPNEYIITSEAVERSLSSIKERKSNGPDEIPNWVLKNFSTVICRPVCSIFNSSIAQGHVPSLWKCANVLPLGKVSQPRSIESDLRPISLTAVLSKVLEGFVFNWLTAIVLPHVDPFQFGCVKKSSTTHALVHLIHQWLSATETPQTVVRSCMIDFSKAFDRIDHNILLHKLRVLNVPPILLNWCSNFLQNRQQRVKLGNSLSSWKPIHAGVPQGTKLGPLFFLVMVNDLRSELPMYKYVDDVTVFEVVSRSAMDSPILQQELDQISDWTKANNMKLNVSKTKELTISFLKNHECLESLTVNSQPLDAVQTIKLLGVHLSSDLKWTSHIDYICAKASKRLYALRTLRRSGVPATDLLTVYCYFIRPVLDYACPVWHSSLTSKLSDQVEHIQRRAIRIILPHLSYAVGLTELNLNTLYDRRESLCKSFYISNLSSNSKLYSLLPEPINHGHALRNPRKLPLFRSRTERFRNSFLPYSVRKWDRPFS